ncbi:MAG TPA: XdhC family protein [bacterium]|nr:XdhC family protein [bacterium]
MKELRDILEAVDAGMARGERMALATIISVRGSTYRREGARLLVAGSGAMVGNISGGCLEGDIAVVADQVMGDGTPRLATYDLTADDDVVWGLGLGCNGAVDVFVEPVEMASEFLRMVRRTMEEDAAAVVALVVAGTAGVAPGSRLILHEDGRAEGDLGDRAAADRLRRTMDAALREGRSARRRIPAQEGDLDVFIEVLRPPIRLVVCGAGHDAIPVVTQATALGWRVVVVDKRDAFLTQERFPGATFLKAAFAQAGMEIPVDGRTAVLVMTHNYLNDRDVLRWLLTGPDPLPFYLGMLGPRERTEKLLKDLASEGVAPSAEAQARLFGPVGLDLGSEGPEEIALSALAEILAVDRARSAGFLRDRPGSIHAPVSP